MVRAKRNVSCPIKAASGNCGLKRTKWARTETPEQWRSGSPYQASNLDPVKSHPKARKPTECGGGGRRVLIIALVPVREAGPEGHIVQPSSIKCVRWISAHHNLEDSVTQWKLYRVNPHLSSAKKALSSRSDVLCGHVQMPSFDPIKRYVDNSVDKLITSNIIHAQCIFYFLCRSPLWLLRRSLRLWINTGELPPPLASLNQWGERTTACLPSSRGSQRGFLCVNQEILAESSPNFMLPIFSLLLPQIFSK